MPTTKANPKLPQSTAGITSLGAVGGARGTAAGGLRILVEFLTTYDPKAVDMLEADLLKMEKVAKQQAGKDAARLKKEAALKKQLADAEHVYKSRIDAGTRKMWRDEANLQGTRTKAGKAQLAQIHADLQVKLKAQGLSAKEIALVNQRFAIAKKLLVVEQQIAAAKGKSAARTGAIDQTRDDLGRYDQMRKAIPSKLAGLAIGAVGGIVGGAVFQVAWDLADKAIQAVGESLQDIIDPARHARENMEKLAESVNSIADGEGITSLAAAQKVLEKLGTSDVNKEAFTTELVDVANRQKLVDALKEEALIREQLKHAETLEAEALQYATAQVVEDAKARGAYHTNLERTGNALEDVARMNMAYQESLIPGIQLTETTIDGLDAEQVALNEVERRLNELVDAAYRAAEAQQAAAERAAESSALWDIYTESLTRALEAAMALQGAQIDSQIEGLGSGESKKTKRLKKAVGRAQNAGSSSPRPDTSGIAEERALVLLKMRLRLLGTAINLEKYSGKFLLVAINAKIAALQKEGEAQDRINKLLDLRYRQSKVMERQEGESINDFLARRAQEQRDLLSEEADLRREAQVARLNERKEVLEDELRLQELAERKAEMLRSGGTNNHLAHLQKRLKASQEADKKALEAKKKALEKERKEQEEANRELLALTSDSAVDQTLLAIRGMRTVEDVAKFSGRLAGLQRAKNALEALTDGFGLPKDVASAIMGRLNAMIGAANAKINDIYGRGRSDGNRIQFASGGVFELKNSSTNFGQNVRVGEEGREIGIVLSHRVAKILQQQKGQQGQIGPFIIQQSDDPFRDRSRFGRLVRDNVEAALG